MNNILPLKSNISSRDSMYQTQSTRHKKTISQHLDLKCLIVEFMSLKIRLKYDRPLVGE